MCEKAIAIGTYFAASGAHVIFGVGSPVGASEVTTEVMTRGWEELVGGSLEFIPDWNEMLARSLELIDGKRTALKLQPYDPTQFGASGDAAYFEAVRAQLGGYGGNGHGHTHSHDSAAASDSSDHADTTEA
jgi:carbon-monoxide dehydrogenase catalytic subunit